MTSLEGVPHRMVRALDLRIVVTGATSCRLLLTLANGTLMARRPSVFQAGRIPKSPCELRVFVCAADR
jgi:hypothetical protein